jgi:hypothetical protein
MTGGNRATGTVPYQYGTFSTAEIMISSKADNFSCTFNFECYCFCKIYCEFLV